MPDCNCELGKTTFCLRWKSIVIPSMIEACRADTPEGEAWRAEMAEKHLKGCNCGGRKPLPDKRQAQEGA